MDQYYSPGDKLTSRRLNSRGFGLRAIEQDPPSLKVDVIEGVASVSGNFVKWETDESPTFSAPSSGDRIDLLSIDSNGNLNITQGAEDPSPVAPAYPDQEYVICEIYLRPGCTEILNVDDSSEAYIMRDVRVAPSQPAPYMDDLKILKDTGDGSDGDLVITSGTTNIDLGGAQIVTKQYNSISITGTGQLTFSNPHANGTYILLKVKGDVTITSSASPAIDASGMGAAGGTGGAGGSGYASGSAGSAGSNGYNIDTATTQYGTGGSGGSDGGGGSAGTGGLILPNLTSYPKAVLASITAIDKLNRSAAFYGRDQFKLYLACGSGGGGGGGGSHSAQGGAGGRGGGVLRIHCGGDLNFTSTISVAGKDGGIGQNGLQSSGNAALGAGGGGGGAGGMILIIYNTATAASGTKNTMGGAGGKGGRGWAMNRGSSQGGGGGGGAGAYGGAGGNGNIGSSWSSGSAAGGTSAGGGGGSGGSAQGNSAGGGSSNGGASGGAAGASDNKLITTYANINHEI